MRNRAPLRIDVASYLRGAIDINNPNPQYTLRSLPGRFSGMHL